MQGVSTFSDSYSVMLKYIVAVIKTDSMSNFGSSEHKTSLATQLRKICIGTELLLKINVALIYYMYMQTQNTTEIFHQIC